MKFITILYGILFVLTFITSIIFVLFGQITVRKLRKNLETKDYLGVEYISGMDIVNVAQTFLIPKWFHDKAKDLPYRFSANYHVLYKHTTRFDRIFARVFCLLHTFTWFYGIELVLLDQFGFFE